MAETKSKSLAQKLSAVMGGVDKLKKDGHNNFQNYDFVSESNVVEAVRQLLVDNGVLAIPSVKYHWQETRVSKKGDTLMHSFVLLNYRFMDTESNEEIISDWLGEGSDSGDKGFYKAYTGAQKYALMKTFLIPTGDDPENDSKVAPAKPAPAPKSDRSPDAMTDPQQGAIMGLVRDMELPPVKFSEMKKGWGIEHLPELSKAKASFAITELSETFLTKILALCEQLGIDETERDKMYDRHGLDLTKLSGKALNGVYVELGEIAKGVEA